MPRRRRRRRHTTEPRPIQVERKYCDALADEEDHYTDLLCPKLIPANGPRFCPQHIRECAESYNIYKDASLRAEELQPYVYEFSRKHKRGGFQRLWEVDEVIEVMGEFIYWAELELDERKTHAYRFYAHEGSDPGHNKRMVNVAKLIDTALAVRLALTIRQQDLQIEAAARRRERERERLFRGWRPPRIRSPSPEVEEVRVVRCFAMRVIRPEEDDSSEECEVEGPEELDDSALAQMMDAEELLADDRAEREVSEMLRWYAQSVPGPVIGSRLAREDSTERLTLSMENLDVLDLD